MYGSILIVLSALSAADNPKTDSKLAPGLRQTDAEVVDLSGYYTCKGQEAGGKNYTGVVVLTKKNDIYLISWLVGGGSNFSGIAIRQGTTLSASWAIATERGLLRGVNMYRIESTANGPRLSGRWASVPGPGVQQTETLTFLKKLETDD